MWTLEGYNVIIAQSIANIGIGLFKLVTLNDAISIKLRSPRMKSYWLHLLAVPVGAWQNRRVCTRLHFTRRLAL